MRGDKKAFILRKKSAYQMRIRDQIEPKWYVEDVLYRYRGMNEISRQA